MNTRRDFLTTAALGAAAVSVLGSGTRAAAATQAGTPSAPPAGTGLKLGTCSYNFRKFNLDQTLAVVKRLGLSRMVFKDFHLPLNSTDEQIHQAVAKAAALGIEVYGCGTIYMKTPAEVEQAFRYAKAGGFTMIIGAPNVDLLPLAEKQVQATGIKLAIHNHGPDNPLYSSPLQAYDLVKNLDPRMGLCVDVGHTQRYGLDPVKVLDTTFERVFDIHFKDETASTKAGTTIEIGRGVMNIDGMLRLLLARHYAYTLDFEFEKDPEDPLPGLAESIGYVRGMLKLLGG